MDNQWKATGELKIEAKLKILKLMKIMMEQTDEYHGLSAEDLCSCLAKLGISAERKAIYRDIETLQRFGMDIKTQKNGNRSEYYLVSRTFELAELKLLVDAVEVSKFITEKKSQELIEKLQSLTSRYDGEKLIRGVTVAGRVKAINELIFTNVDQIATALQTDRRIKFQYFEYDLQKQEKLRHDGKLYEVSPWHLCWDNEKYYMIAYDAEAGKIKHYRVDKMKNIAVTADPREGQQQFSEIDISTYTRSVFGMFGGKMQTVKLVCENWMVGIMIDRFGIDIDIKIEDEKHFYIEVEVAVSNQFFGWVYGLGGGARIAGPENVVKEFNELLCTFSQ